MCILKDPSGGYRSWYPLYSGGSVHNSGIDIPQQPLYPFAIHPMFGNTRHQLIMDLLRSADPEVCLLVKGLSRDKVSNLNNFDALKFFWKEGIVMVGLNIDFHLIYKIVKGLQISLRLKDPNFDYCLSKFLQFLK